MSNEISLRDHSKNEELALAAEHLGLPLLNLEKINKISFGFHISDITSLIEINPKMFKSVGFNWNQIVTYTFFRSMIAFRCIMQPWRFFAAYTDLTVNESKELLNYGSTLNELLKSNFDSSKVLPGTVLYKWVNTPFERKLELQKKWFKLFSICDEFNKKDAVGYA